MNIETGYTEAEDGRRIFMRFLLPETPEAVVIILHGYAEHSGRYEHVMNFLGNKGYAVYTPDHRGHGRSAGVLADIESMEKILEDIRKLYKNASRKFPDLPLFLLGHSMGGLLALLYAQRYQQELKGMILTGVLAKLPADTSPFLIRISGLAARLLPRLPVEKFDYTKVSRDPKVIQRMEEDPLYYKGKVRTRTGFEIIRGIEKAIDGVEELKLPLLILHGGDDANVDPEASELVFRKAAGRDKTKEIFPGLRHEILNEPEKQEILELICDWIEQRL